MTDARRSRARVSQRERDARDPRATLALAQGSYYVATGLWPLFHLPSFLAVTGPKHERWLVRTFGALTTAVGAALLVAARQRRPAPASQVLGGGAAVAICACEAVYVRSGRIAPVYLADAVLEAGFAAGWGVLALPSRRTSRPAL